jgi:hypothetical protein
MPPLRLSSSLLAALMSTALLVGSAWAGRPLGTDDAGTAGANTCQVESWFERARDQRAWTVSPACGLGEALELGVEFSRPSPAALAGERHSVGLAMKWVDPAWQAGPARFGLKAYAGTARQLGGGWQPTARGLMGLATLALGEQASMHLNLGDEYDRGSGRHQALGQVALTWQPLEPWMLFGELQALRGAGGAQQTLGARWWALKDRLGLDLTAGRTAGQAGSAVWTLGLGWYGIGL